MPPFNLVMTKGSGRKDDFASRRKFYGFHCGQQNNYFIMGIHGEM